MTGDDVRSAKFRERLRGYDPAAVDAALDVLASRLDAGELHVSDLADLHFPVRLRGYHQSDVDRLLQQLRRERKDPSAPDMTASVPARAD